MTAEIEGAIPTFDQWMAANVSPAENYTYRQYSNYIQGWRNSMPWAWRGMSTAYDRWAEANWDTILEQAKINALFCDDICPKAIARLAWKEGLALVARSYLGNVDTAWRGKTAEEAASFALTFRETIAACCYMALAVLENTKGQSHD